MNMSRNYDIDKLNGILRNEGDLTKVAISIGETYESLRIWIHRNGYYIDTKKTIKKRRD